MPTENVQALVLRMTAGGHTRLKLNMGRLVHAAFFEVLRQLDSSLAERLHNANQRKLYTISPLWADIPRLQPGDYAWVRIALLDPTITRLFVEQFLLKGKRHRLRIGHVEFAINDVYATGEGHPRAGQFSLQIPDDQPLFDTIQINFLTPTAFSRRRGKHIQYETLLMPRLVWNYARRMWGAAGGADPGQSFDDWCEQHTSIVDAQLETTRVNFGKFYVIGAAGVMTYRLVDVEPDDPFHRLWCYLGQFLPFSSVGYKATMGLGQCVIQYEC